MATFASANERVLAAAVVLGFFVLALVLHVEFFGVRVLFDDSGIETRSPWRPRRQVPWSSVTRVHFSNASQWYVVETQGHGRVRLHIFLGGIESLLTELERRGVSVTRRPGV